MDGLKYEGAKKSSKTIDIALKVSVNGVICVFSVHQAQFESL